MNPKIKVFILNFLGFAILFLMLRFTLDKVINLSSMIVSIIVAVLASILAPKFAVVKKDNRDKVLMKWIFIKGFKEI